ncbi:hypothetical protein [Methylocystis echinoides]|uniref:hypothetical protein n=1 Tax=Methylocystis echinoides TaxID=29468 RepID=UPI00249210AF|nr:hypothetical protein [Methylocystis echinoides]
MTDQTVGAGNPLDALPESGIPDNAPERHGDTFTRDRFVWLDQIAEDATLPPTAARLAIVHRRITTRKLRSQIHASQ